jgi:hypothetical protein
MIVVIGKEWLSARNAEGQLRLSDPNDFVGLEVSLALQRGVLVVPVLVGGAQTQGGRIARRFETARAAKRVDSQRTRVST